MRKLVLGSLGCALLFTLAVAGCKQSSGGGDSMGSMKMDGSPASTMPATMSSATTYTCTMHPEVTSDKPGKCPKCGMDLVARK